MNPSDKHYSQFDMLSLAVANAKKLDRNDSAFDSSTTRNQGDATVGTKNKRVRFAKEAQPEIIRPTTGGPLQLRALLEAPWGRYEKIYDLELGGSLEVAVRKASPVELVHVRKFSTQATPEALYLFRCLRHRNIVTPLEAFTTDSNLHIVLEHMPVSLQRIIDCPAYPDERQLAAILGQVSFYDLLRISTNLGRS